MRFSHPATTPNTSFGQSMYGLHLGDTIDMDVKVSHRDPYHDQAQAQAQNAFPPSQPMQYSTSHAGFNSNVLRAHQDEAPFAGSAQSSFAPGPTPSFEQSFSMFDAPYHPQAGVGSFTNSMNAGDTGFPYNYEMFPPPIHVSAHRLLSRPADPSQHQLSRRSLPPLIACDLA
jgi:hypothetical protein